MQHRDEEVSHIMVILKPECVEGKLDATVTALKNLDMKVEDIDGDNGAVQGTICTDKLDAVRKWTCVDYVRVDFTYIADYPMGDPRNQDTPEEASFGDGDED